jgi:hypothetical protein
MTHNQINAMLMLLVADMKRTKEKCTDNETVKDIQFFIDYVNSMLPKQKVNVREPDDIAD